MRGMKEKGRARNIEHDLRLGLQKQIRFSESKHELKAAERQAADEEEREYQQVRGIFSATTLKSYQSVVKYFSRFAAERGAYRATDAKQYVEAFVKDCIEKGQSAWTVHLKAYALACAYNCDRKDLISFELPKRERKNIIRSRNETAYDQIHSERAETLRRFASAIGCRRIGAERLCKDDLIEKDGKLYVHLREKNGMIRDAVVIEGEEEFVRSVFDKSPGYEVFAGNGVEFRLFPKGYIPKNLDVHACRAEYATRLYRQCEEKGEHISGKLYRCRKDMAGRVYDRGILGYISENLGHHRLDVVLFYLR